jgi:Arc/MetJ-type ribon-helix-helix transcriptional regulator
VKLSVSLSEAEVAALDKYARAAGLASRSAAIQQAIRLLGDPELEESYAAAWDEWEASGDAAAWEATAADGLIDAAR